MSRIAFINPTQNFEEVYGSLSEDRSVLPPLGLCYLANVIKSAGHEAKIVDAPALKISNEQAVSLACAWGARFVGVTATTDTIFVAGEIANMVKAKSPQTKVIIGGAHVTAVPEDVLKTFLSFDFGVIGEGEETLKELVAIVESERDVSSIQGIAYRSFENNVKLNTRRDFIQNLDSLPFPAWELLPDLATHYKPMILNCKTFPSTSLVTSRGCPGRCSFCDTKVFGSKYRIHSAEYVLEMMRHLMKDYGIKDVCFYDDVFTVFKNRLIEICEGLINQRRKISWSCQARVNFADYEMMRLMKKAGCWKICYGIESGSDEILKGMNKNATVEQAKKAVREAKRAGLEVEAFFILGYFGETKETLNMTRDFIANSNLDMIILSFFLPYPGSSAYARVKEYGQFDEIWKDMNVFESPRFIPKDLSVKDIMTIQDQIYKRFYLRPKMFAKYALKMMRYPKDILRILRSSLNLVKFILKK